MNALVLENPGSVVLKDVEFPKRKYGEALLKIKSVSVCGSDISAFRGKGVAVPYPLTLGHEIAAEIEEIEDNEFHLKVGDRVILNPYIYCGHCYPCSIGSTNCCESLKVLGVQTNGAMSEFFSHPINLLHKVPDNLQWELIPLAEPLVIALHGLKKANLQEGEHVVILGAGPIGILAGLTALSYNAIPILVDILPERLNYAKSLGIEHVINSISEDATASIKTITNGRMAEVVLEMSGSNAGIASSLEYASYCGRISLTGWPTGTTELNTSLITRKELSIKGARTGTDEFHEALELISSGKVAANAIISKVIKFNELPQYINDQSAHPESYLKIVALL